MKRKSIRKRYLNRYEICNCNPNPKAYHICYYGGIFCVFSYTSNINQINVVCLLTITSLELCILFDIWFLILFFTLQSMTSFVLWKFFNFVSFFKIFSSMCHVIRRNFIRNRHFNRIRKFNRLRNIRQKPKF